MGTHPTTLIAAAVNLWKCLEKMESLPKVLVIDLSNHYGGSSSRVLSLLARAEPEAIGLAGLKSGAITRQAIQLGLRVHAVAGHKADPRILPRLIRLIRKEGYDILDSQNIQSKFWANLAANITKTPIVSTINSWYPNEHGNSSVKGRVYSWLELSTNQNLDLYITVSEQDRRALLGAGVPEDAIELIYNAVDVDIAEIPRDAEWLRKKFDLPPHSIVCTAVGRLVPVKGYDVLITAIQEIAPEYPQLFCLIVGEGEYKEELTAQIGQARLENRVRLVGYYDRKDVLSIVNSSDVFIMPSRYEGTPVALLEAAALARPILASSSGGIPELVVNGEHALLVPPEDPTALARGLVKLILDHNYAQRLGQNAQQRIRQNFNLETQVTATWDAYIKARSRHKMKEK